MIGALVLGKGGSYGGSLPARARVVPDRTITNNFLHKADYPTLPTDGPLTSQRLRSVSSCANGLLPEVNVGIGAPMCTFAYGGISPSKASAFFDLILGPDPSIPTVTGDGYNPTFDSTAPVKTNGPATASADTSTPVYGTPYVPHTNRTVYSSLPTSFQPTPLPTYNIWQRLTPKAGANVKIIENQGPVYDVMTQHVTEDVMAVSVNDDCTLQRLYPISKDLMYQGAILVYPADQQFQVSSRQIQAQGLYNCGFQLHFNHSKVPYAKTDSSNNSAAGSMQIEWGAQDPTTMTQQNVVSLFRLTLTANQPPFFEYRHPTTGDFVNFPVEGPTFAQVGAEWQYSVFVHFAGPVMLIGFGNDVEHWNTFNPPDADENQGNDRDMHYPPFIPVNATIQIKFQSIACSFVYGPIAFNNYHPENLALRPSWDLNGDFSDCGYVKADFAYGKDRVDEIQVAELNATLLRHRVTDTVIRQDGSDQLGETNGPAQAPMYFGDWRAYNISNTSPELQFQGTFVATDTGGGATTGRVSFITTVEGPLFFYLRTTSEDADVKQGNSIVRHFTKWGDLASYMTGWQASYDLTNHNSSFLKGTATVTLEGLGTSPQGDQILAWLQENKPIITLGAGYDQPNNFFQGFVSHVSRKVQPGGKVVHTLHLTDILTFLVSWLRFPRIYFFDGAQFSDIIRACMIVSNLETSYIEQFETNGTSDEATTGFAAFRNALTSRLAVRNNQAALNIQSINGNPRKVLKEVLDPILEFIVGPNVLPVLWWDYDETVVRLDWRLDDDKTDTLYFLGGENDDGVTYLPITIEDGDDSRDPGDYLHGVLVGDFTEETNNDALFSDFVVQGQTIYGEPYVAQWPPPDQPNPAYDPATLDIVEAAFDAGTDLPADIGYVGFPMFHVTLNQHQGILLTKSDIMQRAQLNYRVRTKTYSTINFECTVTKPLSHMGRFKVRTFAGHDASDGVDTDSYFYRNVSYTYNRDQHVVKATINGEVFPTVTDLDQ